MMEPSESEAKQTISVKDSEYGSKTSNGLGMLSATNLDDDGQIINSRTLSSSSSTSSSSSEDPLELKISDQYQMGNVGVPEHDKSSGLVLEREEDIPVRSMPWQEKKSSEDHTLCLDNDSTTQFPSTQVMERSTDPNPSSSYRIPSSVFARTKSNNPIEWSVNASSDSLFSIYMGNMSFTRDHENWLGRSEELGLASDCTSESTFSGPSIDFSSNLAPSNQHPIIKSTESELKTTNVDANESKAAETMREVIQENEADYNKEKLATKRPPHSPSLSHHSNCSGESVQSFAFPILTGDDKSDPLTHKQHPSSRHQSQPQTPKVCQSPRGAQLKSQQLSERPTPKAKATPEANPNGTHDKSWFSCFPRSSFCC